MSVKQAEGLMLFVTFAWSSSYLLMKIALEGVEPFNLIALRFCIAFICVSIVFFKLFKQCTWSTFYKGVGLGALVWISLFGTVTGVKLTTASAAAFLGTTTVVLVPIIEGIWRKKWPPKITVLSIALAFLGLILFTVKEGFSLDVGAIYCLWGTFGYASYIIILGNIAKGKDGILISMIQFAAIGVLSLLSSFVFETPRLPQTNEQWGAVLILAIVCSAFCFLMQMIAQRYISPSKIGLIYSMEPVFAAVLAYVFLHEVLGLQEYIGATFIMIAIVLKNIVYRSKYALLQRKRKHWNRKLTVK
ncbi:DMT family transporter [Veillonella criceti]|uniref:Putative DMT superfamily transporter inner membrane protein n=1 Tax=Veillonella criceti TaxID=103891 RepID=A0A380NLY0_9FIRM|nr:DMT family transporter [Veillonella criceti]SUP44348.1 putative DMT superfamily transporter inner membrane protein [Veillonella criceti]